MARILSRRFAGAKYHVTDRGDGRFLEQSPLVN
jgi:hypothetical protein